jgi:GH15 family glucan-1,4-alpha-glucosidase
VVQALNRLGAVDILENYLGYLRNIVDRAAGGHIQPLFGVGFEELLTERFAPDLPGYRGMGPVRVGNQAFEHIQNDVYGQIILSTVQAFFDERLLRPATVEDFEALEPVGERAFQLHDQPDASLWEFRGRANVHTYSSAMCWAACDRLGNAAEKLGLTEKAAFWNGRAAHVRKVIEDRAWNDELGRFASTFEGDELDASPAPTGGPAIPHRRRPAQCRHPRGGRGRPAARRLPACATPSPTTSAHRRRRSTSAPSG